jgi:hypothetical protein
MEADDKVRLGYQGAIALMSYEGQVIWRAFRTLLGVNSIVASLSGVVFAFIPSVSVVGYVLSVLGIAVCIVWYFVLSRQFSYYDYWIAWARHLETTYLSPEVQIMIMGRKYGQGGEEEEASKRLDGLARWPWSARPFRVKHLLMLVILLFVVLYVALLILAVLGRFQEP